MANSAQNCDKKIPGANAPGIFSSGAVAGASLHGAEQQGKAPQGGQTYHHIDDTGEPGAGSAADKGYQIEIKQPDQPPVQSADDGQGQRDLVKEPNAYLLRAKLSRR